MNRIVIRYPIFVRWSMVLVCLVLAVGILRGPVVPGTMIVATGAVCLTVAILAYKAEVEKNEVRVRYLPFYTKRTPMRDITHLLEGPTFVLFTATSKIPLWGLSIKDRGPLFEILPKHIRVMPTRPRTRTDSATVIRRHFRRTSFLAVAFIVSLGLSVPFLKGNPWNKYVDIFGKYIMFWCLCTFLLLLFQAGFAYVLWSSRRDFDKVENELRSRRRS